MSCCEGQKMNATEPAFSAADSAYDIVLNAHFVQRVAHRMNRQTHFLCTDGADATNPEGFRLRQLSGIQDEAFVTYPLIEILKVVLGICRCMDCDDDRRLDLRLQEWSQAQLIHACHQCLIVLGIPRQARHLTTFGEKLTERFMEGYYDMGWRREAPLRGFFHVYPLVIQIERERQRVTCTFFQYVLAHQNKTHSWRAFDTLSAGGNDRVKWDLLSINFQCAKGAHRVNDQTLAVMGDDFGDVGHRV